MEGTISRDCFERRFEKEFEENPNVGPKENLLEVVRNCLKWFEFDLRLVPDLQNRQTPAVDATKIFQSKHENASTKTAWIRSDKKSIFSKRENGKWNG